MNNKKNPNEINNKVEELELEKEARKELIENKISLTRLYNEDNCD